MSQLNLRRNASLIFLNLVPGVVLLLFTGVSSLMAESQVLKTGWSIRSSADVSARGEEISTPAFNSQGWYSTGVPSTVLAALSTNRVYRDLYYGRNMETVSREPFRTSWWYRKEFDLNPTSLRSDTVRLKFDGINYSANIFVNGKQIASSDTVYGSFRRFDLDISKIVRKKGNVLAVEVYPPKPGDFTIGFVDWNPNPPDRNMGLFREVTLSESGPVTIDDPVIRTKLDLQSLKEARLTVAATVTNHSSAPASGNITGEMAGGITFKREFALAANESRQIQFTADDTPQLTIKDPRIWWPNNLGTPELYSLKLSVQDARGHSDSGNITFGIREVSDYLSPEGHRGYVINGRKVLIRGAGWVDDMLLQEDENKLVAQIQYAKHLNLNTIRLEGFWGSSEKLYELADQYGLLVMVGFSCQWEWKEYLGKEVDENFGGIQTEEDMKLVVQYLHDQVIWLRNHPSIFVWALGSDMLPKPELEKRYLAELSNIDPTRPSLSSTKGMDSSVSGPSGVKMNGPYEYETPNYWYVDTQNGGAFGFNTETGPGPQPPPMESIQNMFASEHYWPIDDTWNYHCGRNEFNTMNMYMTAFNKRYGEGKNLEDFTRRAQAANYEAIRPMFEAFSIRRPATTGIVQWMMNGAWPKMFWQLYDYFLMPGGSFYGARKANQPLNVVYDYGNGSITVTNDGIIAYPALDAEIKVLSTDSKELFSKTVNVSIGKDESRQILVLPQVAESTPVYFVSLKLKNSGKIVADNFYWLSTKADVLDEEKTDWYYTPIKEYADFTSLSELAPAQISVEPKWNHEGVTVTLTNPTDRIAFFIELKIVGDKTAKSALPVFWDDNYVSLLPGETKELSARFSSDRLRGERPVLQYSGWNVKQETAKAVQAKAP